jgi:hypothetical protein
MDRPVSPAQPTAMTSSPNSKDLLVACAALPMGPTGGRDLQPEAPGPAALPVGPTGVRVLQPEAPSGPA